MPPGWNEWYGSLDNPDGFTGGTYTAYGYTLNENGQIVHYGTTPDAVDPATYQTDVYSQKAADFIRRRAPSDKPFYLSVAPRDPHAEAAVVQLRGQQPARGRRATRDSSPASTAPRTPDFNEADVSDKPSNIKNLPLLDPAPGSPRSTLATAPGAEALLGVDDLVQNVVSTLKQAGRARTTRCSSSPPTTASSTASTGSRRGRSVSTSPRSACRS